MSLVSAFVDAFKKAAARDRRMEAAQEAVKSGQAGTLGSTPGGYGGSFDPLRPAPAPEGDSPADFKVEVTEGMTTAAEPPTAPGGTGAAKPPDMDSGQTGGSGAGRGPNEEGLLEGSGAGKPGANASQPIGQQTLNEPEPPSETSTGTGDGGSLNPLEVVSEQPRPSAHLGKDLDDAGRTDNFEVQQLSDEPPPPPPLSPPPQYLTDQGFKIGDIKGESKDSKHPDEIFESDDRSQSPVRTVFDDRPEGPVGTAFEASAHDPFKIEVEDAVSLTPATPSPTPVPYPLDAKPDTESEGVDELARKAGKGQHDFLEVKLEEAFVSSKESPEWKVGASDAADEPGGMAGELARKAGKGQHDFLEVKLEEAFVSSKEPPEWKVGVSDAADEPGGVAGELARKAGKGQHEYLEVKLHEAFVSRESPGWKVDPGRQPSNTLVDLDAEADGEKAGGDLDDASLGDLDLDPDTDVEDLEV